MEVNDDSVVLRCEVGEVVGWGVCFGSGTSNWKNALLARLVR